MPVETLDTSAGLRVDRFLSRLAEGVVRGAVEPRVKNLPLWDSGLGEVVDAFIAERGVPARPITAVDVARRLGILQRRAAR
jgi:hypothetical protein